jgi:hypothetical protein
MTSTCCISYLCGFYSTVRLTKIHHNPPILSTATKVNSGQGRSSATIPCDIQLYQWCPDLPLICFSFFNSGIHTQISMGPLNRNGHHISWFGHPLQIPMPLSGGRQSAVTSAAYVSVLFMTESTPKSKWDFWIGIVIQFLMLVSPKIKNWMTIHKALPVRCYFCSLHFNFLSGRIHTKIIMGPLNRNGHPISWFWHPLRITLPLSQGPTSPLLLPLPLFQCV